MQFNLSKVKNPVNQTMVVEPDGKDPITFTLRPIDTDISFACERWRNSSAVLQPQMQFDIGVGRVAGWTDVVDETGAPIPFTNKNLGYLCSIKEAIPYFMEIGIKTIEEVYSTDEKKTEVKTKTKGASASSSETSSAS